MKQLILLASCMITSSICFASEWVVIDTSNNCTVVVDTSSVSWNKQHTRLGVKRVMARINAAPNEVWHEYMSIDANECINSAQGTIQYDGSFTSTRFASVADEDYRFLCNQILLKTVVNK